MPFIADSDPEIARRLVDRHRVRAKTKFRTRIIIIIVQVAFVVVLVRRGRDSAFDRPWARVFRTFAGYFVFY